MICAWLAPELGWGPSPALARADACRSAERCREEVVLSTGRSIPVFRSRSLLGGQSVRRAVFVIQGNRRDADRYFERVMVAAELEERGREALVVAPNFRTLDDGPDPREHHWSSHGWKIGNKSLDASRFSSFAALDELLAMVCSPESSSFPKLEVVVILGHSAGGQFVNRYAAGGAGCPSGAIETRYVIMNPSSYLYVDARRRSAETGEFEIPRGGCPKYDEYRYGLRDLNGYMRRVGKAGIRERLFSRRTFYLSGDRDTRVGGSLDTRCQAIRQGPNRRARHEAYRDYSALFDDWKGAVFVSVPGIGHSGGKMIRSDTARRITFR